MKGTAGRGRTTDEDARHAEGLRASAKERAENLMIVDMVRNDLGRVATPGSVTVPELFTLERYPSLWQLTSTVEARTEATTADLLAALFPCASITGAPKVRTMEILRRLEDSPRGIYTGAIGWMAPGGRASFNVAIRTLHVDRERGRAEYGTGGGIVWDSDSDSELRETRTKAAILFARPPAFELLETLAWRPASGYRLLRRHLARLADSAAYFGIPCDVDRCRATLDALTRDLSPVPHRMRLRVTASGEPRVDATQDFAAPPSREARAEADYATPAGTEAGRFRRQRSRRDRSEAADLRVGRRPASVPRQRLHLAFAARPIDPTDRFLYHKTTHRELYDQARAGRPGYDDVLLWNPAGEVTESTVANLVVRLDGRWVTPPLTSGLLPGTFREALLARGRVREERLSIADLRRAERLLLASSVRGFIAAEIDWTTAPRGKGQRDETPAGHGP